MKSKRLLSLVLAICLLIGLLPAVSFAEDEQYYLCFFDFYHEENIYVDYDYPYQSNTIEMPFRDQCVLAYGVRGNIDESSIISPEDYSVSVSDGNAIYAWISEYYGHEYIVIEPKHIGSANLVINYNGETIVFPYTVMSGYKGVSTVPVLTDEHNMECRLGSSFTYTDSSRTFYFILDRASQYLDENTTYTVTNEDDDDSWVSTRLVPTG